MNSFTTLLKLTIPKLVVLADTYMLGGNVLSNAHNFLTFEAAVITLVHFLALLFHHSKVIAVCFDLLGFLGCWDNLSVVPWACHSC